MFVDQLIFAQLMDFLPRREFNACVRRYRGDRRPRSFSCRDQFLCLAFAQLTFRESLRDIETCLRPWAEIVSRRTARQGLAQHAGRCEPRPRLADLRRFRARTHSASTRPVCSRDVERGTGRNCLRTRLDDHRSVLELVSLGPVSSSQRSSEASYAARPARKHSVFCACFSRKNARCHGLGLPADRAQRLLRDGSRLRRFPTLVPLHSGGRVLRDPQQEEPRLYAPCAGRSTRPRDCAATKRSSWLGQSRRDCIPMRCVGLRSTMPRRNGDLCS